MYDFDTLIDRAGTGACKWDRRTDEEKRMGCVPMSVADMEFAVAPPIKEAAIRAAEKGIYGYTDPDEAYFGALFGFMKRRHGIEATPEDVIPIHGVVPALATAVRALTKPGEAVIVQPPVYPPFYGCVETNGRQLLKNPLVEEGGAYRMDFENLAALAARPEAKLLLLCSPHNPVGRVWTREELARLSEICVKNGVTVVSDEIHSDLILLGEHTPFCNLGEAARNNCVVATAPSKTFNVPGLKCANLFAFNPEIAKKMRWQIWVDGDSNLNYFALAAAKAAYTACDGWLDALLDYLRGNEKFLRGFFAAEMPEVSMSRLEGTYLAWCDFRSFGLDAKALEAVTRGKAHLILDEGYIFGELGEGFERFNIALPRAALARELERLKASYPALSGR